MPLSITVATEEPAEREVRARLVLEGPEALDGGALDLVAVERRRFRGKVAEVLTLPGPTPVLELLVGVGPRDRLGREALRRAGAALWREAAMSQRVSLALPAAIRTMVSMQDAAEAVAQGARLASYRFARYQSTGEVDQPNGELVLVVARDDEAATARGAERAEVIAAAVGLARDLVNTPAGDLSPRAFAEIAQRVGAEAGLEVRVDDEHDAEREGLGGLLGVAAGSLEPPRLVRVAYRPSATPRARLALVGKGITFDSGGLSLKPATSMVSMKTDMSGAAAVLATLVALARLGSPVEVIGFMPLAENLPGARATKPGDVLRVRNGKTIEVLNTDAEGRLVLADALSLATEEHPDAIVDLATLTGACIVALGRSVAGLMGNDVRLVEAVRRAGLVAGEPAWPLPLPAAYRRQLDSEVADYANIGQPGQAGALIAGLLLAEFVGATPWAHLDIAGPARSEEDAGYLRKGGTGFGVRTLIELIEHYVPLGGEAQWERPESELPGLRLELP